MPNMKQIIANHNKTLINTKNTKPITQKNCNCRQSKTCPLNGQCQTKGVVYQATVTRHDNNKEETYIGLTENTFKIRHNQHTHSFRHDQNRNQTALSKHIWTLKDKNIDYSIKWRIVARGRAYTASTKSCRLCIKEKYFIIFKPQMATLNIRNELGSEGRHRKKHLLCNA